MGSGGPQSWLEGKIKKGPLSLQFSKAITGEQHVPSGPNSPAKAVTETHGCDSDEPYLLLQSWLNTPTGASSSLISATKNW